MGLRFCYRMHANYKDDKSYRQAPSLSRRPSLVKKIRSRPSLQSRSTLESLESKTNLEGRESRDLRTAKFGYIVQFGNNSLLIRQLIRGKRKWLHPVTDFTDDGKPRGTRGRPEAPLPINFLWTQYRCKAFLNAMPRLEGKREHGGGKGDGESEEGSETTNQSFMRVAASFEENLGPQRIRCLKNTETELVLTPNLEIDPALLSSDEGDVRNTIMIHNHLEGNQYLCTKKGIFETLKKFYNEHGRGRIRRGFSHFSEDAPDFTPNLWIEGEDPFASEVVLPRSFLFQKNMKMDAFNSSWADFLVTFEHELGGNKRSIWIVKPGDHSNRGAGIKIYDSAEDIRQRLLERQSKQSMIVQRYIEKPLLIDGRKFDVRSFILMFRDDKGKFLGFAYPDIYLRTASDKFSLDNLANKLAHLNNDAVQRKGKNYGKLEAGNKLTIWDMEKKTGMPANLVSEQILAISTDLIRAGVSSGKLDPFKRPGSFEIFGLDFMVDTSGKVWLLECNTNPCLDPSSSWLAHLIPCMLDQALNLTLDLWAVKNIDSSPLECVRRTQMKWKLLFMEGETSMEPTCS